MHCPGHVRWPDNQEIGYFNVVLKGSEIRYHTIWDTPIVATTHPWSFSDLAFLLDRYTEEQQRAAIAATSTTGAANRQQTRNVSTT